MARWKVLSALPSMSLGKTLFQVLGEYFPTERARIAFTFQSKYLGMAPWRCPGFYAMIPFVEHRYGIYHTRGGLSEISVAMAKVATELGATFRYNTPVQRLLLDKRKVTGVVLADGREERADVVVVNADFGYAATKLVPPGTLKRRLSQAESALRDPGRRSPEFQRRSASGTTWFQVCPLWDHR